MLRNTWQEVIQMVRAEAKLSTNTSRGIDFLDNIRQLIKRNYYTLAEDYDWPHLAIHKETAVGRVLLQAGLLTYTFPTALNPLKVERALVKWGSVWIPLDYGIKYENYSSIDPDRNQRLDPVTNWQFYSDTEFEVWPKPASNGVANDNNELAFEGQRKVTQLVLDGDRLDLDDQLIALTCAAEILAADGQKTAAEVKAQLAVARMGRLRANNRDRTRYTMGAGVIRGTNATLPRHPTYIRGR